MNTMMTCRQQRLLCTALALLFAGLATTGGLAPPSAAAQSRHSPERNFCGDRLPVAQERIRQMYSRAGGDDHHGQSESFSATVTAPTGESFSVSVESGVVGEHHESDLGPDDVRTGLADLVFNCGKKHFSEKECFVDVYLDGEKLTSMGPNTHGRVPLKCLPAGRHELRIDSVADTIFQGTINLSSDVEHLARIEQKGVDSYDFDIYARNSIPGRIPQPEYDSTDPHDHGAPREGRARHHDDRADRHDSSHRTHRRRHRGHRQQETSVSVDMDGMTPGVDVEADISGGHVEERARHEDRHRSRRNHHTDDHRAMSSSEFDDLTGRIEEESFSDGKLRIVDMASDGNWFTTDQVEELIGLFSFGSGRVEVAVELYDRTVDREDYYKVLSAFEFDSNKQKVRQKLDL